MALAAADDAPGVVVDNGQILLTAWGERVVEVVAEPSRLLPSIYGIAKEHAQQVTTARLAVGTAVSLAGMHDAQVVDELDIALLAIKLGAEALCKLLDSMQSMQLLGRENGHARVAVN